MRYSRILQRIYKTKKRSIWDIRHIGYWKRRNYRNPIDIQKQYVSKGKKDSELRYSSRSYKVEVENFSNRMVQKAQWSVRLQRV